MFKNASCKRWLTFEFNQLMYIGIAMIKYLCLFSLFLGSQAKAISDPDLKSLAPVASRRATDFLILASYKNHFESDIELCKSLSLRYQTYLSERLDPSSKKKTPVKTDLKRSSNYSHSFKSNIILAKKKALVVVYDKKSPSTILNKRKTMVHRDSEESSSEWLASALRSCELGGPFQMRVESLKVISLTSEGLTEAILNLSGNYTPLSLKHDRYELLVSLVPLTSLAAPAVCEDQGYSYTLILNRKAGNVDVPTAGPDMPLDVMPSTQSSFALLIKPSEPLSVESCVETVPDSIGSIQSSGKSSKDTCLLTNKRKCQMSSFSSLSDLSDLAFEVDE